MCFRIALTLLGTLLLLPVESSARVYKCEAETGISYSSQPCPETATATAIETASGLLFWLSAGQHYVRGGFA